MRERVRESKQEWTKVFKKLLFEFFFFIFILCFCCDSFFFLWRRNRIIANDFQYCSTQFFSTSLYKQQQQKNKLKENFNFVFHLKCLKDPPFPSNVKLTWYFLFASLHLKAVRQHHPLPPFFEKPSVLDEWTVLVLPKLSCL